jgi:hypothetical protein
VRGLERILSVFFPFGRNFATGPATRGERRASMTAAQQNALARRRARNKVARRSRRVNRIASAG